MIAAREAGRAATADQAKSRAERTLRVRKPGGLKLAALESKRLGIAPGLSFAWWRAYTSRMADISVPPITLAAVMTIYMTKVWGFDVPSAPLQFSTNGWRDNAREVLQPGDLVVCVGTKGAETAPRSQGRLLGMMEPTTEVALSFDFELQTRAVDYDEEGNYRWPYALLNRRAWRFLEPRPLLEEISPRSFAMDSALGIVPLTADEAARIESLPKEEVPLLAPVRAVARIEGEDVARRRAAPPPTTQRAGVMHVRHAPA